MVGGSLGLRFDIGSGAPAGDWGVRECEIAVTRGDLGKFLDDLEEVGFIFAAENPGLMDGGGEDLVGCPVVRRVRVRDRHIARRWLSFAFGSRLGLRGGE